MKALCLLGFLSFFSLSLFAQSRIDETKLVELFQSMRSAGGDKEMLAASKEFETLLKSTLYKSEAWEHPFTGLPMCKLYSPDKNFRIFNWNIPKQDGSHIYRGYIQIPLEDGRHQVIELEDKSPGMGRPTRKTLNPDEWYGALYFNILPIKKGKSYALLGWDGADALHNQKIIDVLSVNGTRVKFGAPIFKGAERGARRIFLPYPEELVMSLDWDAKEKRLLFDHMVPIRPELEGNYAYYTPDSSFDAFLLEKGSFRLQEDVEYQRERVPSDRDFIDPRVK